MIRSIALAAAAAAVGYALGQRVSADAQSRFSRPEVTGDDVALDRSTTELSRIGRQSEWPDSYEDGRIGR